jgi:nucleoside-diphosphate-sugar epimerase
MKSIFLTGSTGFVGTNLVKYFINSFEIIRYKKGNPFTINQDIVIHLAGKAHDLKKKANFEDYYNDNTELTKQVFDAFISSKAKVFITLSSVKAVADKLDDVLTEITVPSPRTHYGKSKLLAEQYINSHSIPNGKRVYILRPCLIHGKSNKGNLNLLFNFVSKGIPWPLGAFENQRSFCTISNLLFIINELIYRDDIDSGIYNVADDESLSTNSVISILSEAINRKPKILNVSKVFIKTIAILGDLFHLPLTTERLQKLTESYIVSNLKIKSALNKSLPFSVKDGLFDSFNRE